MNGKHAVVKKSLIGLFACLCFAAGILFLAGCRSAEPDADALQAVLSRGVLRVGTTGDYRPMSYLNPRTHTYEGFDAALAEDLAASLGVRIEYVPTSWPTLMRDTLDRKFDLALCGITITQARKEQALMSDGYLENGKTVLCRSEDAEKYISLEAAYYCGKDPRLAAPLLDRPFTHGQLGVLLPPGSEALLEYVNGFLEKERRSGRLDELSGQYIHLNIPQQAPPAAGSLAPAA